MIAAGESMMVDKPMLLVVDDDPGMRSQLKWGLDEFDVYTAEDRQDALELFNKLKPMVVTLDLGLPPDAEGIQEGLATLQQILKQAPATRIVVVSGCIEKDCAERAVKSGAFEFCSKPIEINKLNVIISRAYESFKDGCKI
jgi:two-component system, NtrC family, response regulator